MCLLTSFCNIPHLTIPGCWEGYERRPALLSLRTHLLWKPTSVLTQGTHKLTLPPSPSHPAADTPPRTHKTNHLHVSFGSHNIILLYLSSEAIFVCTVVFCKSFYIIVLIIPFEIENTASDQKVGGAGNRLQQPTTCMGMACKLRPKLPVVLKTGWLNHSIF